jgi:hypothetical protein
MSIASSMVRTSGYHPPMFSQRYRWRRSMAGTLAVLAALPVVLFGGLWLADFFWLHVRVPGSPGPFTRLFLFDPDTLETALGNLTQIIAAVLGIAITVVSIVVQLAATRYTPRVADMFFRSKLSSTRSEVGGPATPIWKRGKDGP